jgi:hypothetical protein
VDRLKARTNGITSKLAEVILEANLAKNGGLYANLTWFVRKLLHYPHGILIVFKTKRDLLDHVALNYSIEGTGSTEDVAKV